MSELTVRETVLHDATYYIMYSDRLCKYSENAENCIFRLVARRPREHFTFKVFKGFNFLLELSELNYPN